MLSDVMSLWIKGANIPQEIHENYVHYRAQWFGPVILNIMDEATTLPDNK